MKKVGKLRPVSTMSVFSLRSNPTSAAGKSAKSQNKKSKLKKTKAQLGSSSKKAMVEPKSLNLLQKAKSPPRPSNKIVKKVKKKKVARKD